MKRFSRAALMSALLLAVASFGVNDVGALCGNPGMVSASAVAGGTYYVMLFSPVAPFNWTGTATTAIGVPLGDAHFAIWLDAITTIPTNYLRIVGPGPAICGACEMAPPPAGGPYAVCPGPTATIIYD